MPNADTGISNEFASLEGYSGATRSVQSRRATWWRDNREWVTQQILGNSIRAQLWSRREQHLNRSSRVITCRGYWRAITEISVRRHVKHEWIASIFMISRRNTASEVAEQPVVAETALPPGDADCTRSHCPRSPAGCSR